MQKTFDRYQCRRGFSLAEALASVVIGAMVLVAMLQVYGQAEKSAASVRRRIDSPRLPSEILQRIAEDLDGIIASDPDTKISVENKLKGFPACRLTIQKTIKDSRNRPQVFEKIVWQSSYDYFSDVDGLVLFRSHSGMSLEDKMLDEKRALVEKEYPLVPICGGVTYFKMQVPRGEELLERWLSTSLPPGVVVAISFAAPFETVEGTLDVLEEEKTTRTIAIDRTRKMKFEIVKREPDGETGDGDEDEETGDEDGDKETGDEDGDKETAEGTDIGGDGALRGGAKKPSGGKPVGRTGDSTTSPTNREAADERRKLGL
ncbi:MAG: type IV pilus modification PilV family protein [Planctomycetota bacterium]|jgi:hypothetical protein